MRQCDTHNLLVRCTYAVTYDYPTNLSWGQPVSVDGKLTRVSLLHFRKKNHNLVRMFCDPVSLGCGVFLSNADAFVTVVEESSEWYAGVVRFELTNSCHLGS
jgi:hypothetical protein